MTELQSVLGTTEITTVALLAVLGAVIAYSLSLKHHLQRQLAERLEIEKRLRDSEAEYRDLIDHAPFPIVMTRMTDNTIVFANRRLLEQFELRAEQLLGKPAENNYENPEDRRRLLAILNETGQVNDFETCLKLRNGLRRWVYISAAISRFNNEDVVFLSFNDITARKLADERLQRVLRELPIATIVVSQTGHLVFRSEKFEALFGYPYAEVGSLDDWLPRAYPDPTYREEVQKIVDGMIAESQREGRASTPVELRVRCRDGRNKVIEFRYVDLVEQGIWTMSDMTARNELASAMRKVNDHLMERLGEIQSLQEQLREQAIRDVLTGLYNRRYLDEVLERELARAMREGHPLTVMMLDLDHFKKLNDTYGHQAGDEVLKALGEMLRRNARTEDIPCRYGGEEFLLVLPNMNLADARVRAEQWREKFETLHMVFGQFSLTCTLSIGIATFPGHGRTRDELIEAADQALYVAKHNGRNRVEVCPDAGQARSC